MSNYRMDFWSLTIRIILFSKCITRMLAIFSFIFYYLFLYYRDCTIKSTCLNVMYLMYVNILISLSSGVPPQNGSFRVKQLLNNFYVGSFCSLEDLSGVCPLSPLALEYLPGNDQKSQGILLESS